MDLPSAPFTPEIEHQQRTDGASFAHNSSRSHSERQPTDRADLSRCTTLAQGVQSPLQWKKARYFADAAICLAPRLTGVPRCSSSRPSWAVAGSSVQARRSPLPQISFCDGRAGHRVGPAWRATGVHRNRQQRCEHGRELERERNPRRQRSGRNDRLGWRLHSTADSHRAAERISDRHERGRLIQERRRDHYSLQLIFPGRGRAVVRQRGRYSHIYRDAHAAPQTRIRAASFSGASPAPAARARRAGTFRRAACLPRLRLRRRQQPCKSSPLRKPIHRSQPPSPFPFFR